MANNQTGQINLGGGGAVGFTPNTFTQPPTVFITVVRNAYPQRSPINVYITGVNKDSFGYTVQFANGGVYTAQPGDKLNWLAIGA